MACAAITLGANAQSFYGYRGGPNKGLIDLKTLDQRAKNYRAIINDKSSDVRVDKKNGRLAWFGGALGKDFMGYYDECITSTEKQFLDAKKKREAKKKAANKAKPQNNRGNGYVNNPFADY